MGHTIKIWERGVEARLGREVMISQQQCGFKLRMDATEKIDGCREGHAEEWCDSGGCRNRVKWKKMTHCGDP